MLLVFQQSCHEDLFFIFLYFFAITYVAKAFVFCFLYIKTFNLIKKKKKDEDDYRIKKE
jgi:hypothetical protein